MFGEIGLIELGQEFLQIFVREEDLRLSVIFQLSDALHRILTNDIFPLHPIKEVHFFFLRSLQLQKISTVAEAYLR